MSSVNNNEVRHRILEILYKAAQERPGEFGVSREKMREILQTADETMDFNMLYLGEKGLVKLQTVMATPWVGAEITALGIDVIENEEAYVEEFPFIQTAIQEIHGNVYGPAVQAVSSQVNFIQQLTNAFNQAYKMTEERKDISDVLKIEVKKNLDLLRRELEKEELDLGKIQKTWNWLKSNANWVIPTLTQVVIEGLRRVFG